MWYIDVPPKQHPPLGGNWTALAWREDSDPKDTWRLTYRHRYYCAEEQGKPIAFPSKDKFSWYEGKIKGTEEEFLRSINQVIGALELTTGEKAETFWIRGDSNKFFELPKPYWIATKTLEPKKVQDFLKE